MSLEAPSVDGVDVTGIRRPHVGDIHFLSAVHDYPCVSILVATRSQVRMAPDDLARLNALVRTARTRLTDEGIPFADELVDRIAALVDRLRELPTDAGLAVYATADMLEYRHLPVSVEDRVVVDPTFATRDLVRAVQANPSYLLLVVDSDTARLYRSDTGALSEAAGAGFPLARQDPQEARDAGSRPGRRRGTRTNGTDSRDREQLRGFLRRVDALVAEQVEVNPRPVVVMAGDRVLSEYLSVTGLSGRIIGLARSGGGRPNLRRLEKMVRPLLADHLKDLEAAAQDTMSARLPGREVVNGLASCWHAAVAERPELLLVEQSYAIPARVSADGELIMPVSAGQREWPQVIDDAIDELIELVIAKGGQVRFVPDGSLREQERVALSVLMPRRRHAV